MTAIEVQPDKGQGSRRERPTTATGTILRIGGLIIFTAFSLFFIFLLLSDGYWPLAAIIGVITLVINYVFLAPSAYPMRWMSPGLVFLILISIYPIIFTIYISFTNFGASNLLPKVQAIEVLEARTFLPEPRRSWTAGWPGTRGRRSSLPGRCWPAPGASACPFPAVM